MPAMVVNDDVGILDERGALRFFAGKPAPTEGCVRIAPKDGAGCIAHAVSHQYETGCFNSPVVTQGTVTLRRFSLPNRPAFTN